VALSAATARLLHGMFALEDVGVQQLKGVTDYGWFTESFDTADLQEAKVLLEDLRKIINNRR
jgi:hypothetical protein